MDNSNLHALLQKAVSHHQQGDISRAKQLYEDILSVSPVHFEALHYLALIKYQTGDSAGALDLLEQAILVNSQIAEVHSDRSAALSTLGRLEEALASAERALILKPDLAAAHMNQGNALYDGGRFAAALISYDAAIQLKPGLAEAHCARGNALCHLARLEEALESHTQAIFLKPSYANAYSGRASALYGLNFQQDALAHYDRAVEIEPTLAEAWSNRAGILLHLDRRDEALASCDRALQLQPALAEALGNRGDVLQKMGRLEEARDCYAQAIKSQPSLKHKFGDWIHTKMKMCDWQGLEDAFLALQRQIELGKSVASPFPVLAMPLSARHQRLCAEIYTRNGRPVGDAVTTPVSAFAESSAAADLGVAAESLSSGPIASKPPSRLRCARAERIRLAYFSSDLREHAVARAIAPLIEAHDRTQFEVIAFSLAPAPQDPMRQRLEAAFDQVFDIHAAADIDVLENARDLAIDIAIDLNGFTGFPRPQLFAKRVAPVQVSFIGYPGTTGADYMDYKIGDAIVIPEKMRVHFSEKIVTLPHTYLAAGFERDVELISRQQAGLPEVGFVFCCFNNTYKISPDVFDVWMRLLRQTPSSVLWLAQDNPSATSHLRSEAEKRGVAQDRLIFASRLGLRAHLARMPLADLFLDTFNYNAHTTALAALWAGVPVVTKLGDTFASRVGGSLLKAIGLPELICGSIPDYESLALRLANDAQAIGALRAKLARQRLACPLFDVDLYARHVEAAYKEMWRRSRLGLPADHIAIHATP